MKKFLLIAVMALLSISADAQYKPYNSKAVKETKVRTNSPAQKNTQPLQVAGTFNAGEITKDRLSRKVSIDVTKLQPAPAMQRRAKAMQQAKGKAFSKGMAQTRHMSNLKPIIDPQSAKAFKASQLAATYTGKGYDYFERKDVKWTMTPYTAELDGEEVSVFFDLIPTPNFLTQIFPNGIPVEYTIQDDVITVMPQSIASYQNEAKDSTFYITLFSANSEDEEGNASGIIKMEVSEEGHLKITDGNMICLGEFAFVEFDSELSDGDAYLGFDELIADVRYLSEGQKDGVTVEKEYGAYGIDDDTNDFVTWTLQQGTYTEDDEDTPIFVNMTPFLEEFSALYPDGIWVEYTQIGNTIVVEPQMLAYMTADDNTRIYLLLHSYTSEDGNIVLTIGSDGSLNTIKGEEITIGAWETENFDSTYETWMGKYASTRRVKYQLPGAEPLAPEDVACEAANTIVFAGQGLSGYYYNKNLSVIGAYAPTNFKNITEDPASDYEWSVVEDGYDTTTLTGKDRDFAINTTGGFAYEELKLTCYNQGAKSETFNWGCTGVSSDTGELMCDSIMMFAGGSDGSFQFTDGSYPTMTTKSSDDDMVFYTNWGTPDLTSTSMCRIYSYQGKPSTPLYIEGVTLPLISFEGQDDFNLHLIIYKCTRTKDGRVTLGDIIAESDATLENVNTDYADRNIFAIEFTDLYVEDEMGMSESLDYLFIEDEFLLCFDGWDNGTFSGVIGSDDNVSGRSITTWFEQTGDEGYLYRYTSWKPQLFVGFLGFCYGYLHTEDNTDLTFDAKGGEATIHVEPMYYAWEDAERTMPRPSLYLESITVDGEEAEEIPDWINIGIENFDESLDDEGYPNNIDYDLVFGIDPMEDTESRKVEIVYMQTGARLKVTITQGEDAVSNPGDVNGDGEVDVADISAIISVMAGQDVNFDANRADTNGDGEVDVADISNVISIMAGK